METCQICQMYLGIIWQLYSPRSTAKFGEASQSWKMIVAVLRNQWVLIWGEASRAIYLSDIDAQCLLQPGLAGCCFAKISNNSRTTEICFWRVWPSVTKEESQLKTYADVVGFSSVFCYAIVIPLCLLYLYGKQHIALRASRTTVVAWQHIQQKFCTRKIFVLVNFDLNTSCRRTLASIQVSKDSGHMLCFFFCWFFGILR